MEITLDLRRPEFDQLSHDASVGVNGCARADARPEEVWTTSRIALLIARESAARPLAGGW
jgi:hypothetical protein